MERIKKIISCFVSNTLHFCLEYFITLPSGRCLAENWGCCRSSKAEGVASYPKLEKRWLLELYGSIPWSFFAILPLLNVEAIVLWMVLSILLVYTTFIPYSSMQNACSLSHSCLILHPSSSTSMCKLSCHHSSLSSSPCAYPVLRPYLAETPVDS